ncbi:MAG: V-type ATP synthase subunit F [Bacillota bacterium]|nr:V-type ATP synthase subunit F [Bacillota bacterium]
MREKTDYSEMNGIAVLGDLGSIIGFRGLGLTVVPIAPEEDPAPRLKELVAARRHAVIYITEAVARACEAELALWQEEVLPAIIPIPSATGATGYGTTSLRTAVRRAVGFDILDTVKPPEK